MILHLAFHRGEWRIQLGPAEKQTAGPDRISRMKGVNSLEGQNSNKKYKPSMIKIQINAISYNY